MNGKQFAIVLVATYIVLAGMLALYVTQTRDYLRGKDTAEMASQVTINGRTYIGGSVNVQGSKVYIDGKLVDGKAGEDGILKVVIQGDAASVMTDAPVEIQGNVNGDVRGSAITIGGSVKGSINGSVVNCGDVGGSVNASVVNRQ